MDLMHATWADATRVFWRWDSAGEVERGPSTSKGAILVIRLPGIRAVERVGVIVSLVCPMKFVFFCWSVCCHDFVVFFIPGLLPSSKSFKVIKY